jgi:hypothetical protein
MALKLRPSGLSSGIDKDRPDYTVYTGEWEVGRIYHHALSRLPSHEGGGDGARARQCRDNLARRPIATQR